MYSFQDAYYDSILELSVHMCATLYEKLAKPSESGGNKKIVNASVVVVAFLLLSTVYAAAVCN